MFSYKNVSKLLSDYARFNQLTGVTLIALILAYCAIRKYKNRNFETLAAKFNGPLALPLVGNILLFMGPVDGYSQKFLNVWKKYGTPVRIWIGPKLFIVIGKPEDMRIILNSSVTLEKPDFFSKFLKVMIGNGLLTSKVERWKKHRRVISPVFNSNSLSKFTPVFVKKSQELMERLKPLSDTGKVFNLWHHIYSSSVSAIFNTMLDYDLDANSKSAIESVFSRKAFKIVLERICKIWLHSDMVFNFLSSINGNNEILESVKTVPKEIIAKKEKVYRERKKNVYHDRDENQRELGNLKSFLDTLLEQKENDPTFTKTDVLDEVLNILAAGADNTALSVSFTLLMLAMHSDIQEKLYEEVKSIVDANNKKELSVEDIGKMRYLDQCIKETLRLFPPAPFILRNATADIEIGDLTIPRGANIVGAIYATHRDPLIYPNPDKWNPDNFLPEVHKNRHKYSFLPFAGGPRQCIGYKYAMLSMKVTVATAILSYKFDADIKMEDIKIKLSSFLLNSVGGYPVKIYRRTIVE